MKQFRISAAFLTVASLSWAAVPLSGSRTETWAEALTGNVLSPRIISCGNWMLPPVITLGSDETLEFSFDTEPGHYGSFTYHIDHCDADWKKSDLLYSEYMDGFDNERMEMGTLSQNTTYEYEHYSLTFPNESNSPKLSGNYMLTISHDNTPDVVFRFCVCESVTEIRPVVTDVTDIDTRGEHQQVMAKVDTGDLPCFDAGRELKLTVMQNLRFDNAARTVPPDFIEGSTVSWQHCKPMIFDAGNGFRRFEVTDVYANAQNVGRISYIAPYYHVYLNPDEIRESHYYDSDHNGRYLVRSTRNGVTDSDTESDYVLVHFELHSELLEGGTPYVFYQYDGAGFSTRQQMEYSNTVPHCYTAAILMKTGSYDYQYIWVPDGEKRGETGKIEGNWSPTPNEYLLLLYQRRPGDRYDRLVSYAINVR